MATKKSSNKKGLSGAQKVGIGVGLTTAAVAAAGAYFLYGSKDAAKNRKKVKGWALKAKGEVLEVLEKAEEMTKDEYDALIEQVAKAYGAMQGVSKADAVSFVKEMKQHWKEIEKKGKKMVGKSAPKKAAKKAASKAKKAAPKKSAPKKK